MKQLQLLPAGCCDEDHTLYIAEPWQLERRNLDTENPTRGETNRANEINDNDY